MLLKNVVIATVALAVFSLSSIVTAHAKEKPYAAELKKFQGTWVMESAEHDGKAVDDKHVKKNKIKIVGDKVEVFSPHQHKKVIYAQITNIDTTKNPKEIHWVRKNGPKAGTTMMAIYEFEGPNKYKVIFDPAKGAVPQKFGTEAGSGHLWHTWNRSK